MIDYLESARSEFTWWLESLNKRFGRPWKRDLITLFGYMSSWKTEFTYFVSRKNAELGNKVCYIYISPNTTHSKSDSNTKKNKLHGEKD